MPLSARRLIFWLFVAAFFLTATGVLSYSLGYKWSWSAKRFVRTGLISITTIPSDATIALDGELLRTKTPQLLKSLLPAQHSVRLEKDGFLPFEKSVPVAGQQTTFLDPVVLFSKSTATPFSTFGTHPVLSPDTTRVESTITSAGWTEVWEQDVSRPEEKRLLSRYPKGSAIPDPYAKSTDAYTFDQEGGETLLVYVEEDIRTPVALLPPGTYRVEEEAAPFLAILSDQEKLFLIDTRSQDAPILLRAEARAVAFAKRSSRIIYTNGYEVRLFDMGRLQDELLLRTGERILSLAWHPEESVVFIGTQKGLSAIHLHSDGGYLTQSLGEIGAISNIQTDPFGLHAYLTVEDTLLIRPLR